MPRDIGFLLGADEALTHQVVDTFATVMTPDLSWTEKIWVTLSRKDGSLQVDAGLGKYPNRNVIDGFAGISRGLEQWTVRASRELDQAPEETAVGPIRYEVVKPLETVRFVLDDNDAVPLGFDLEFQHTFPAFFEDRHRDREHFRVTSDVIRYHQPGTVRGWIDIDGERVEVRPDEWFGFRDHSWGVRPQVGVRPSDLAPPQLNASKFHMHWTPMLLERPDGTRYEVHYYFIGFGAEMRHFTGHVNHADGRQERIVEVQPDISYHPRTRDFTGGRVTLVVETGEKRVLEVEPLSDTGFHLHPALYGTWNDAHHGTWRGRLHVEGEQIANCNEAVDGLRVPIWQLRDRPVRVREGEAHGLGILESMCFGDYPEFGVPA